jgi:hypothetical protein
MAEQSHRETMNAAIRAQRERHAAPRSLTGDDPSQAPEPPAATPPPAEQEPPRRRGFLQRLLGD